MKKGMGWPIGIVAILSATVIGNVSVIMLTNDDPSFAVEPDYYRKAVDWDSAQARTARSNALDWHVMARVSEPQDGSRLLTLDLTDSGGAAVRDAQLSGTILHIARANDVVAIDFAETSAGQYSASVPILRDGMWELRLSATRDEEQFMQTVRIDTERQLPPEF